MKSILKIFLILLIVSSVKYSQEYQSSFPKFTPYVNVKDSSANKKEITDIKIFGMEQPARWLSVDPKADKYPAWSPYNYGLNRPISVIDPDGRDATGFIDPNGTERYIDDGSNALFVAKGSGTGQYYKFAGFDPYLPGKASINLTTIVQEAQNLNDANTSLDPNEVTKETYCNFATQNIMRTVESTPMFEGALITGQANNMQPKLDNSDAYTSVDYKTAKANAETGGLSIYSSLGKRHGHVGTFSVGDNITKGEVANIGKTNGFMQLFGKKGESIYRPQANVQFFILRTPNGD